MLGPIPSALGSGPDVTSHALVTFSRVSLGVVMAIHEICVIGGFLRDRVVSAGYKVNSAVAGEWDVNRDTDGSFQIITEARGTVTEC